VSHSHHPADYWTRRHTESVVLDIGDNVGALVLYTDSARHGQEIEVSPLGSNARRVHSAVLERSVNGRTLYAAVYPELEEGDYEVCGDGSPKFTITAGSVVEVNLTRGFGGQSHP
jgi:hypothetical protein